MDTGFQVCNAVFLAAVLFDAGEKFLIRCGRAGRPGTPEWQRLKEVYTGEANNTKKQAH